MDEMFKLLAQGSDNHIDATIASRIGNLVGKDAETQSDELYDIMRDCVNYSLVSDFTMGVLYIIEGKLNAQLGRELKPRAQILNTKLEN